MAVDMAVGMAVGITADMAADMVVDKGVVDKGVVDKGVVDKMMADRVAEMMFVDSFADYQVDDSYQMVGQAAEIDCLDYIDSIAHID